jgi:hypothetical protein
MEDPLQRREALGEAFTPAPEYAGAGEGLSTPKEDYLFTCVARLPTRV